jgi:hypothetical protein
VDERDVKPSDDIWAEARIEEAFRLRRLSSELAGGVSALETLLKAGDLRGAYSAANLLSDWAINFSLLTGRLRDSITEGARQEAQRFLDETS